MMLKSLVKPSNKTREKYSRYRAQKLMEQFDSSLDSKNFLELNKEGVVERCETNRSKVLKKMKSLGSFKKVSPTDKREVVDVLYTPDKNVNKVDIEIMETENVSGNYNERKKKEENLVHLNVDEFLNYHEVDMEQAMENVYNSMEIIEHTEDENEEKIPSLSRNTGNLWSMCVNKNTSATHRANMLLNHHLYAEDTKFENYMIPTETYKRYDISNDNNQTSCSSKYVMSYEGTKNHSSITIPEVPDSQLTTLDDLITLTNVAPFDNEIRVSEESPRTDGKCNLTLQQMLDFSTPWDMNSLY